MQAPLNTNNSPSKRWQSIRAASSTFSHTFSLLIVLTFATLPHYTPRLLAGSLASCLSANICSHTQKMMMISHRLPLQSPLNVMSFGLMTAIGNCSQPRFGNSLTSHTHVHKNTSSYALAQAHWLTLIGLYLVVALLFGIIFTFSPFGNCTLNSF